MTAIDADYFDRWYTDIDASARRRELFRDALGLPIEVEPSNLVPLSGLHELVDVLSVAPEGLLVDVACGRGGPGMWIARESGCRVVGVDFSPVAVAQARRRRASFGLEHQASFAVAALTATGLADGIADGVVCVDAFQFGSEARATAVELARLLKPGGRIAVTGWEPLQQGDVALPERLRNLDIAAAFAAAGLADVTVEAKPAWRDAERALWERALATDADGDPAIESMHEEAARTLRTWDRVRRRVLATARAPL